MKTTIALFAAAVTVAAAADAHAQAWVEQKGVLGIGTTFQFDRANAIIEGDGEIEIGGDTSTVQTLLLSASYAPIEKLGLSINVPFLFSRYTGEGALFFPHGEWDDGATHAAVQDLRFNARYQILDSPLVLTPNLGFSFPLMDYPTQGFIAPGRGVAKAYVGLSVARTLAPILPRLFFHANYEFALAQKVSENPDTEEFSQNHSQFGVQAGYFITDKLSATLSFDGFLYHDGIELVEYFNHPPGVRDFHDSVLKEEVFLAGANVGYVLSDSLSATAYTRLFLFGDNTRKARIFGISLSYDIPVAVDPAPALEYEDEGEAEAEGDVASR